MDNAYIYAWLGLMVILIGIEAATVNLTTIWLAAGALVAFILSLFNLPIWAQIAAFIVVSVIMIIFTRPIAVKYLKVGTHKTNTEALIGLIGLVIMDISEHKPGQVKVKGQIWTAVSQSGQSLVKGSEVEIMDIEGVKLIVKASKEA